MGAKRRTSYIGKYLHHSIFTLKLNTCTSYLSSYLLKVHCYLYLQTTIKDDIDSIWSSYHKIRTSKLTFKMCTSDRGRAFPYIWLL